MFSAPVARRRTFSRQTNGYVVQCQDGTDGHSGGVRGSCSSRGGNGRTLYSPWSHRRDPAQYRLLEVVGGGHPLARRPPALLPLQGNRIEGSVAADQPLAVDGQGTPPRCSIPHAVILERGDDLRRGGRERCRSPRALALPEGSAERGWVKDGGAGRGCRRGLLTGSAAAGRTPPLFARAMNGSRCRPPRTGPCARCSASW